MKQTRKGIAWWFGTALTCNICDAEFVLNSEYDSDDLHIDDAPGDRYELWMRCPSCKIGIISTVISKDIRK